MYIERVQVEEGFLNGLDLNLSLGLNTVIGARGTGKTSLIELIRFCLGDGDQSPDLARRSRDHALSVLGSGEVTVTLIENGYRVFVSRTATENAPRATGLYQRPIVFSQTEIETIGLESPGRLRLIDNFITADHGELNKEKEIVAHIASKTAEITAIQREVDEIDRQLVDAPKIIEEINTIAELQNNISSTSMILNTKSAHLQTLSHEVSALSFSHDTYARARDEANRWYHSIKSALDFPILNFPESIENYSAIELKISNIRSSLQASLGQSYELWDELNQKSEGINKKKLEIESLARQSRQEIEKLQSGSGEVLRRSQELSEKKSRLDFITHISNERKMKLKQVVEERRVAQDELDELRARRFAQREAVIKNLNSKLAPFVQLQIFRQGQHNSYIATVNDLLRGSGLKYNEVIPVITSQISPRAFLDAIDTFNIEMIAWAAKITNERASRMLSHLRTVDLSGLATLDVQDDVHIALLDGAAYKNIGYLSTGQRCTAILPILMCHEKNVLIVDQPEDHIDNAFIANVLIKSLLQRSPQSQIIFSTHNPNIPVLGAANKVMQLSSDGKRGFIACEGELNTPTVVAAISTIMEGGADAFAKRALFYNWHGAK